MVELKFARPDDMVGRGLVMKHRSFPVIASKAKQGEREGEWGRLLIFTENIYLVAFAVARILVSVTVLTKT